ncbi:GNAT family N-acetyltransferase [Nocardioides sp. KIGAM211]|uniref:GNAT family N-acetyltransferase n=1 Tax=Nocardioides luti TaxID=2761101 RepID=A0A7X0VCE0_9ACTN|nr:GNAT family N-acetyltransferase [Nocardioides luti]MBB6629400.1 GNAT family N-acetyltransferase [Nocardioides luti]
MTDLVTIDPHDEQALLAWFEAEQASIDHDRPRPISRTWGALAGSARTPSPYIRRELVAAVEGDEVVGVAELELPLRDNPHLAEVSVHVVPAHRRRGIGRLLFDEVDRRRRAAGRTTLLGELLLPDPRERPAVEVAGEVAAGMAFSTALGFTSVHEEEHLAMPLPADRVRADALRRATPGYEILTWRSRCPDELRAAYCRMRTQMAQDVPLGDVALVPTVMDEERLRTEEERMAPLYHQVVAAARRTTDGEMAGYSLLFLPRDSLDALQDDTLVMPAHRGHGLGMQLKLATLDVLRAEHPDRRLLHTWTDPTNTAMYRTNAAFGYTTAEILHEMQRQDAG